MTSGVTPEISSFSEPVLKDPQNSPETLLYFLSSSLGLGHASRAVAVAQEFSKISDTAIVFGAHPKAHQFLAENTKGAQILKLDYYPAMDHNQFASTNKDLFDLLPQSSIVVNDFLVQIPAVRQAIAEHMPSLPLVGVYHSIFGYPMDDVGVRAYQDSYRSVTESLDALFLGEPKPAHLRPYEIDSGTTIIPCDPIVRPVTKDAVTVKQELGLELDENFIYIQGGMSGSAELHEFAQTLGEFSMHGLRLVAAPMLRSGEQLNIGDQSVVHMPKRMDGQNIVAASVGVISKPGMGTLGEAIAARKPVLFVGDEDPERKVKYQMLRDILGNELPFLLHSRESLAIQIKNWLAASNEISSRFVDIPCDGAATVAQYLAHWNKNSLQDTMSA